MTETASDPLVDYLMAGAPWTARGLIVGPREPRRNGMHRWYPGDPEPPDHVREVRAVGVRGWRGRWMRVKPLRCRYSRDYVWWNTDKRKPWTTIVHNWGPLADAAWLARMHSSYRNRTRRRNR